MGRQVQDHKAREGFVIWNRLLLFHNHFCIGPSSKQRAEILNEFHGSKIDRHSGYFRTHFRVRQNFFWEGVTKFINLFVADCMTCKQKKLLATNPLGLLQLLPMPKAMWEGVSLNFMIGLPSIKG